MITRRKFVLTLAGAGLGGTALGWWAGNTPFPRACALRRLNVPGPAGWVGRRAIFVTDVHYGFAFGPDEAAALNRLVRAQTPDLIFMGGDLAQTPGTDLGDFFAQWSPGCPTFFAPGNHDTGASPDSAVVQQARAAGVIVLSNSAETWDGLTIVGLPSALRMPQRRSVLKTRGFKIVLAHEPDAWDHHRQADLLQLSGHTHGGQIRLGGGPLLLPELGKKYPLGLYSSDAHRTLFVSAGIGCTTVKQRINCPPELVQLRFV